MNLIFIDHIYERYQFQNSNIFICIYVNQKLCINIVYDISIFNKTLTCITWNTLMNNSCNKNESFLQQHICSVILLMFHNGCKKFRIRITSSRKLTFKAVKYWKRLWQGNYFYIFLFPLKKDIFITDKSYLSSKSSGVISDTESTCVRPRHMAQSASVRKTSLNEFGASNVHWHQEKKFDCKRAVMIGQKIAVILSICLSLVGVSVNFCIEIIILSDLLTFTYILPFCKTLLNVSKNSNRCYILKTILISYML